MEPRRARLASRGVFFDCQKFKLSGSDPQPGGDGGHLPSSNVFCLQADSAFWARANVALNIELGGRLPLLNRFKAIPAVPLAANSCFAPSALVPPGPRIGIVEVLALAEGRGVAAASAQELRHGGLSRRG